VVINPLKEDVIKRVLEETDGKGVDVVTEFSGNKTAIEQSFKYIKPGGKMSMLGIGEQNIDIDFSNDIVFKGIEIYGVIGRRMFETWDQVTLFVQSGKLDLDVIVTHIFKLEEMEKGIQQMISGNSGKVVLIP
jgi:threonine 3-dehydrogenase